MQRVGFLIRVKPERLDAYRRLHDPVPADLQAVLRAAGIRNYSLWLSPDGIEFGYLECDDWEAVCAALERSDVHARWQERMQAFLDTGVDAEQGGQPIRLLDQVFFLK